MEEVQQQNQEHQNSQTEAPIQTPPPPTPPEVQAIDRNLSTLPPASFWADLKKTISSQFVVMLFTPLAVFIALIATEKFKNADPFIDEDDITYSTYELPNPPNDSILIKIKQSVNYDLFQTILSNEFNNAETAKGWLLSNGDWTDECKSVFKQVSEEAITKLSTSQSISGFPIKKEEIEKGIAINKEFLQTIEDLNTKDTSKVRTGQIDFDFEVLNRTSFDGLIYKKAILKYQNIEIPLLSDSGYVTLKPHSVQKVSFSTYGLSKEMLLQRQVGDLLQTITPLESEKTGMANLATLVKQRKNVDVEITLIVDNKKLKPFSYTIK